MEPIPPHSQEKPRPKPGPVLRALPRRRAARPVRRPGAARLISLEISAGAHFVLFLLLLGLPTVSQPAKPVVAKEPIPIEITFVPQPMTPAAKVAPPAPARKPAPEPMPKAAENPKVDPQPVRAAAVKPLPPKPAVRQARPAPVPAQKAVVQPKAPDLQALLQKRLNQGKAQDEQRLADLRAQARQGSEAAPDTPAAGLPQGDPTTKGSGLSGALSSRRPTRSVYPTYPGEAQRIGDEGQVRVRMWVSPAGAVSRVEVVTSSGRGYFDRAALSAMRKWAFTPLPDESAGEQWGDITLFFQLQ